MEERKLTNMEKFLLLVGIACGILGIGYFNLILGGVSVMTIVLAVLSIVKRQATSKDNDEEE